MGFAGLGSESPQLTTMFAYSIFLLCLGMGFVLVLSVSRAGES